MCGGLSPFDTITYTTKPDGHFPCSDSARMDTSAKPIDCFIGSFSRPLKEAYLTAHGFSRGMILFAIPGFGVLFKCRAEGDLLDLEFGAFFALLRFIKTSLAGEKIKSVNVHSSNPEFVFALMNNGEQISHRPERVRMLDQYRETLDIHVSLVPALKNRTGVPPGEFPSTPRDQTPALRPKTSDLSRIRFKPIQKGVAL